MPDFASYQNPSLAVDVVVFGYHEETLSVLLLNRKEEPFRDCWTLPGGFLQMEETFTGTCTRILQTKLGIRGLYLEQLYSFDAIDRDPRGRVISVVYFALVNPARFSIAAGTMANDVQWFAIDQLPALGFDHALLFDKALKRLRAKILYDPAGFELLDEEFTLPELHRLYECVLAFPIDRRNFRRKILDSGFIIPTGKKKTGSQNRHPDIYRFNKALQPHQFQLTIPDNTL
ncbi:MAG: NUDIX domain-containing protein [Chitinophagaceae bacterium]